MRKIIRRSRVKVYFEGNCLVIGISDVMKIRYIDAILEKLTLEMKKGEYKITNLILDLSEVYTISSAAAVGLVCLCSALNTNKMGKITSPLGFRLNRPRERVLTYLATLGFFSKMSNNAMLIGCEDLIHFEYERKQRSVEKQKKVSFDKRFNEDRKPVVLPMKIIPKKGNSISDRDFEDACKGFINQVCSTFEKLFSSYYFNLSESALHGFYTANGELFENIFEHSDSWGLVAIHANPVSGTTVSYYDIGIGIKGSVNHSQKAGKNIDNDYKAMNWALEEGNSSKLDGNGRGLNVVEEYVLEMNGYIEIRSGCCLLYKIPGDNPGVEKWRYEKYMPWFPGTQINFFIPCTTTIKGNTNGNYRI